MHRPSRQQATATWTSSLAGALLLLLQSPCAVCDGVFAHDRQQQGMQGSGGDGLMEQLGEELRSSTSALPSYSLETMGGGSYYNLVTEKEHVVNMYLDELGGDVALAKSVAIQYRGGTQLYVGTVALGNETDSNTTTAGTLYIEVNGLSLETRETYSITRRLRDGLTVTYMCSTTSTLEKVRVVTPSMVFDLSRPNTSQYMAVQVDVDQQRAGPLAGLLLATSGSDLAGGKSTSQQQQQQQQQQRTPPHEEQQQGQQQDGRVQADAAVFNPAGWLAPGKLPLGGISSTGSISAAVLDVLAAESSSHPSSSGSGSSSSYAEAAGTLSLAASGDDGDVSTPNSAAGLDWLFEWEVSGPFNGPPADLDIAALGLHDSDWADDGDWQLLGSNGDGEDGDGDPLGVWQEAQRALQADPGPYDMLTRMTMQQGQQQEEEARTEGSEEGAGSREEEQGQLSAMTVRRLAPFLTEQRGSQGGAEIDVGGKQVVGGLLSWVPLWLRMKQY